MVNNYEVGGYHTIANRDIEVGEEIEVFKEPVNEFLVSRHYVDTKFEGKDKEHFLHYAFPLNDQVYITWDEDHKQWFPLNHSCDPNVWIAQNYCLAYAARRKILRGEALTLDYATFTVGVFPDFECQCGSQRCRRIITNQDYLTHSQ